MNRQILWTIAGAGILVLILGTILYSVWRAPAAAPTTSTGVGLGTGTDTTGVCRNTAPHHHTGALCNARKRPRV